jgi:hypothetical protein
MPAVVAEVHAVAFPVVVKPILTLPPLGCGHGDDQSPEACNDEEGSRSMAHFTTIKARGVGLVEIFRNPASREWHELVRLADPVDGLRAYLIDGAVYVWGSLPLHRDLRPWLEAEIGQSTGSWIGLQVAPLLNAVTVTELTTPAGETLAIAGVRGTVQRAMPLVRLLGRDFTVRRIERDPVGADA